MSQVHRVEMWLKFQVQFVEMIFRYNILVGLTKVKQFHCWDNINISHQVCVSNWDYINLADYINAKNKI